MRIAFVGPFGLRPKGTMSARALPLARALRRRGHQVRLCLPPWNCPEDSGRSEWIDGVEVVNISLPARHIPLLWHLQIAQRLLREALGFDPDVIHCFKPKAYAGLVAWLLWQRRRLGLWRGKLVTDTDDWEGPGGWNEIGGYSAPQRRFFAWQERWGLCHADAITAASVALQTIVWSMGLPPSRVHYLPNGVNSELLVARPGDPEALRRRHDLGDAPLMLLYTRFFEFSLERVIDILDQTWAAVPEARLLIVGAGLASEEREMMRLLEERGLGGRALYVGWVDPDELPMWFAAADVALYPFDDTLINRTKCAAKLVDLLAAGVPVVADAVGQNAVYISQMRTGILVPSGDARAFAEALVLLLRDEGLRHRIGREAREDMRERYTWDHLASIAEQAYN